MILLGSNDYYRKCLRELREIIPKSELNNVLSQYMCELDPEFLGFIDIYKSLSIVIPKDLIVIDFGCYLAAQSYFFCEHKQYIGVDVVDLERFSPPNSKHYICTIQDFINNETNKLFQERDNLKYFAICSYVPDFNATDLVRKTFQNIFCFYPTT